MRLDLGRAALAKRRREPALDGARHQGLDALVLGRLDAVLPQGLGRHVARRVTQHQAPHEGRMADGEELADHAAEGQANEMNRRDVEGIEKRPRVVDQEFDGVRRRRRLRGPAAAGVVAQHPVAASEGRHLRVPHCEVRHEAVRQHHHGPVPGTLQAVIDGDAIGANCGAGGRHGPPSRLASELRYQWEFHFQGEASSVFASSIRRRIFVIDPRRSRRCSSVRPHSFG